MFFVSFFPRARHKVENTSFKNFKIKMTAKFSCNKIHFKTQKYFTQKAQLI